MSQRPTMGGGVWRRLKGFSFVVGGVGAQPNTRSKIAAVERQIVRSCMVGCSTAQRRRTGNRLARGGGSSRAYHRGRGAHMQLPGFPLLTAMAGDIANTRRFFTERLGMRLVKKTVN